MPKALIVVDMINDFVHPKGTLYMESAEPIIPRIKSEIKKRVSKGDLVIIVEDTHVPGDEEFGLFPEHALKGTWGAKTIKKLGTKNNYIVIHKSRFSAFYDTDLEEILTNHNIDEVDVVGVCTHICVMDTVQGVAYMHLKVNVLKDMVADIDPDQEASALKRMASIYGANIV